MKNMNIEDRPNKVSKKDFPAGQGNNGKGQLFLKKQPPFFNHAKHRLSTMFVRGKGTSKKENRSSHHMKKRNMQNKEKIYASSTLKIYTRHIFYYFSWIRDQGIILHSFEEALRYLQQYLDWLKAEGRSPFYIKLAGCAVLKLYPGHYLGNYKTPARERKDIKRSRNHSLKYFERIKSQNPQLYLFGLATGLRNKKELSKVRGTDLIWIEGKYSIHIKGKNGQFRDAPIVGDCETVAVVVEMLKSAGESKLFGNEGVFGHIPSNYDQHVLRSVYAARIYLAHERPIKDLPNREKYFCRNDYRGIVLDKKAMKYASEALGHHRVNVIAASYLWPLITMETDIQSFFGIESRSINKKTREEEKG